MTRRAREAADVMTEDERRDRQGLAVHPTLARFVDDEVLPGTGVAPDRFWAGVAGLVARFAPRCRALLEVRAALQDAIDAWHRERAGRPHDADAYVAFLRDLGYLLDEPPADVTVATERVDPEVATVAAPQLVVPVDNARYAINAANARWGSLYDALYGTDALGDPPPPGPYDTDRGARVVAWARDLLDEVVPLAGGSHADARRYHVADGGLRVDLEDGTTALADPAAFVGHAGPADDPAVVALRHHGLGIELVLDRDHPVGRTDRAGVADVVLEAAVTAIADAEDSVAAVDVDDKVGVYRNWLGLMRGDLAAEVPTAAGTVVRRLADDRTYTGPDGDEVVLPGRALLLVRNVGLLMTSDAVLDADGAPVPEGIVDAAVTVACALHDLRGPGAGRNSRAGSVYVVKPKLHGPDEVAFTDDLFTAVEEVLGLAPATVKLGIMDEERRTTLNLAACLARARRRVAFVNTGFLDRTGDEIRTSMEAGPVVRKADVRDQTWLAAYEDHNVDVGLAFGLDGRGQIGKGMWAAPERMGAMLREKVAHPRAGASCAWVPSPTAATLHAVHYHRVDVAARRRDLAGRSRTTREQLLTLPVAAAADWSDEERRAELDNNLQGILGYVVRWVDHGVGCSKVPDLDDVAQMEDRATCRISSQHVANWLRHGIVTEAEVDEALRRMARVVDGQNAADPAYEPMAPGYDGPAFLAAVDLVTTARELPSGSTEPVLHARRAERKRAVAARVP